MKNKIIINNKNMINIREFILNSLSSNEDTLKAIELIEMGLLSPNEIINTLKIKKG